MMKANKQIGFININEESIDKIIKDGEVVFERGFLRERATTTLPITFGGVGKDLKDYKVYGNTVQNGTPTPDTPIDMVSCGDRTKNLFNILTLINGYVATDGSFNSNHSKEEMRSDYIKVKPNTTYTFKIIYSSWAGFVYDNWIGIGEYSNDKSFIKRDTMTTGTQNYFTFTTSNTTNYVVLSARGLESATKVQFEQNSEFTSYEPYGYKIPVNVRSDNLFDKNNANLVHLYTDGVIVKSSNTANSYFIKCKPNTTYTIIKSNTGTNNRFCVFTCDDIPTAGMQILNYIGTPAGSDNSTKYTINTPNTAKYLCVFVGVASTTPSANEISNSIQILEGSTVPDKYIPYYNETTNIYLDKPLRKIGEYSDYIDFINQKIVRNIDEVVLDGSESWTNSAISGDVLTHRFRTLGEKAHVVDIGFSDKFIIKTSDIDIRSDIEMVQFSPSTSNKYIGLKIKKSRLTTDDVAGLTAWLSSNNVILNYVLLNSEETSITLPNIPTIDGNNILNIETEITPSKVYIKYKSNV